MALQVCSGALLQCSFGAIPATFRATPRPVSTSHRVVGVLTDHLPWLNVPPFGLCRTPANPRVAAATALAAGVPTPAPCVPVLPTPWTPGAPGLWIDGAIALDDRSRLHCAWSGVIAVTVAGQTPHHIP